MPRHSNRALRSSLTALLRLACLLLAVAPGFNAQADDVLPAPGPHGWIVVFPQLLEEKLHAQGVPVWGREGDVLVAGADDAMLVRLDAAGIAPMLKVRDEGQFLAFLIHPEPIDLPSPLGAQFYTLTPTTELYLFPTETNYDPPPIKPRGGFMAVPRIPLGTARPHAADVDTAFRTSFSFNPLVSQIVNATSQANWFQHVKDMSGENPVTIDGITRTILTRYTRAMFPAPNSVRAYATEYILDKGVGWGYTGIRESYTSADSGCSQTPSTWQNVVFTIPGQVDIGQHQQVIFVTHYDSLSYNETENQNYSPGADDAISGGSALFEAMRLFRGYGFKNTIKIIFFSGEEQGLCGSVAYTRQHPAADMWRVVNMDQTAYDRDGNRWMDCYNWDAINSPGSVALGDVFVQTNLDYGSIIPPANLFRPGNKMCQTDHCPFWNVGVAAVAITEDLMHNDICPCFDQSQTATCRDTVTQIDPNNPGLLMFTQSYSWPSQKNAIATVATLAEPLYQCPAAAPVLTASGGNSNVRLSWPSALGVTNYVIEKATSCAGPFAPLTSATVTSYDDGAVVNGTSYAYRLRTCPNQMSACVTAIPTGGASVVYQAGSATVTADTGDHDNIADNCELVTVQLNLLNNGNQPLTNVKLNAVSSPLPGIQVVSQIPLNVGSLGIGATVPASFRFYLGRTGGASACGDSVPFTISSRSDQAPIADRSFALTAEKDGLSGTLNYLFDTDASGWVVTTGVFTRSPGGAPGSTANSMHSRNQNSDCDAIVSPVLVPSGSSQMTMYINYDIETGPWDRAVVRAINTITGVKTLLTPVPGYTSTGFTGALCDNIGTGNGYSGSAASWNAAVFNLAAFAGIPIQIEVRYSTDSTNLGTRGFWFDKVSITSATQNACDAQANACAALPAEVSPVANPVPFTISPAGANYSLKFSEVPGATSYGIYGGTISSLRFGGVYNHGMVSGLCGITDGTPGNGNVLGSIATGMLPANSYFLAVAKNAAGESIYGTKTGGAAIPVALVVCP